MLINLDPARHVRRRDVPPADENILPTVIVEIGYVYAVPGHGVAQPRHSAPSGNLRESALAIVLIHRESFILQRRDRNIGISVIINIPKISAHAGDQIAILGQCHSGFEAEFLEFSVPLVVIQKVE